MTNAEQAQARDDSLVRATVALLKATHDAIDRPPRLRPAVFGPAADVPTNDPPIGDDDHAKCSGSDRT